MIATVCSKWAAKLPSAVTTVHRSSSTRTSQAPIVTIGSIASTMPAFSRGPAPGVAEVRHLRLLVQLRPMPCPTRARTTAKPWLSQCAWTACEMSPSRLPGPAWAMALSRLSRVTSSSSCTRGGTAPTGRVIAQSP